MRHLVTATALALVMGLAPIAGQAQEAQSFTLPEDPAELRSFLRRNPATDAAFAELMTQAEAGDLRAINAVVWALDTGTGVKRNRAEASVWREKAAALGAEAGNYAPVRALHSTVLRRSSDDEELAEAKAALQELVRKGDTASGVVLSQVAPDALVALIQQGLTDRNLYRMGVDGAVGPGTRAALVDYCQQSSIAGNCLTAFDGDAGMIGTVLGKMYPAPAN